MIDDRSHTYLIKWLPPEVNVILRRSRHASRDKMYQAFSRLPSKILPRVIITYGACARGGGRRPGFEATCYGVVQCLPVKSPTIYRRNLRRDKNDRLVSVHTSIDYGDVW